MRHRKNNLRVYVQRSPVALYSCKRRKFCIKIFFVFVYIYVHILNNHVINTAYLISSFLRALCTTGLVAQGINTHPNILPSQNSQDRGKEKKRKKESPKRGSWTTEAEKRRRIISSFTPCVSPDRLFCLEILCYLYICIYIPIATSF